MLCVFRKCFSSLVVVRVCVQYFVVVCFVLCCVLHVFCCSHVFSVGVFVLLFIMLPAVVVYVRVLCFVVLYMCFAYMMCVCMLFFLNCCACVLWLHVCILCLCYLFCFLFCCITCVWCLHDVCVLLFVCLFYKNRLLLT